MPWKVIKKTSPTGVRNGTWGLMKGCIQNSGNSEWKGTQVGLGWEGQMAEPQQALTSSGELIDHQGPKDSLEGL